MIEKLFIELNGEINKLNDYSNKKSELFIALLFNPSNEILIEYEKINGLIDSCISKIKIYEKQIKEEMLNSYQSEDMSHTLTGNVNKKGGL